MKLSTWLRQQQAQRPPAPDAAQRPDRVRWLVWSALACLTAVVLWPDLAALFRASPPAATTTPAATPPATTPPATTPPATTPPAATPSPALPQAATAAAEPERPVSRTLLPPPEPLSAAQGAAQVPAVAAPVLPAADAVAPRVRAVPPPASMPIRRARPASPASQAETLYLKGMHLLQRGRVTEAEALLQKALQLDPGHAFARQALASVWIGEGRSPATEALLQQGLQIAPAQTGWITLLARLQVERGDRQAAIQTLCSGLAGLPATAERHAAPHAFLAALLQQQGEHEEAVTRFTTALRLAPDQGVWWMGLGISLQASGQAQRAAAAYGRALSTAGFPAHLRVFVEQRLQQVSP